MFYPLQSTSQISFLCPCQGPQVTLCPYPCLSHRPSQRLELAKVRRSCCSYQSLDEISSCVCLRMHSSSSVCLKGHLSSCVCLIGCHSFFLCFRGCRSSCLRLRVPSVTTRATEDAAVSVSVHVSVPVCNLVPVLITDPGGLQFQIWFQLWFL